MIESSLTVAEAALQAAQSVDNPMAELAAAAAAAAATLPGTHRPVHIERALFQLIARQAPPSLTEAARLTDDGGLGSLARAALQRARAVFGG